MAANIYRMFRNMISDESSPYSLADFNALKYLDEAIDKLSSLVIKRTVETVTITAQNITDGYFDLAHDIVEIESGMSEPLNHWNIEGDNRINIVQSTSFTEGQELTITYRYKYTQFKGVVLEQSAMNLPISAELGVVLYAIGLFMRAKGAASAGGGVTGVINEKSEDGLRVRYSTDNQLAVDLSSPSGFLKEGIRLMREQPNAQNMYFSV